MASPSGIAMILDKAESMEDVSDQRQLFIDKEPEIFGIISKWIEVYQDAMIPELKGRTIPLNAEIVTVFQEPQAIVSEAEKLQNIEKRQQLGLNTKRELLKMDNPNITKRQLEKKILELMNESNEDRSERDENSDDPRPNGGAEDSTEEPEEGSSESDRGSAD
jgi:hypothetical protein